MGPLGWQETVLIFLLALLLFGPKKLPELGRTIGKAITEFRRASTELRSTFDREMKSLEQETESIKQAAAEYTYDTNNYDYSTYESNYDGSYSTEPDSSASNPSTLGASATEDAESITVVQPEGVIAYGSEPAASNGTSEHDTEAAVDSDSHKQVPTTETNA
jgi:sec-independent protein translocase protein TatA